MWTKRKRSKVWYLAGVVFSLIASIEVSACTCIESYSPWIAEFSDADAVFAGKVHSVTRLKRNRKSSGDFLGDRIVTFEIVKTYKGLPGSTRLISLYSDYDSTSCSFGVDDRRGPSVGEKWIVVANKTETPQMFFGGSCNPSRKIGSKRDLEAIEQEAFKFPERQGILGSVVLNYTALTKNAEVTISGEGVNKTSKVDSEGYYWFPLPRPGKYIVSVKVPFATTLINAVQFPETIDKSGANTTFNYTVQLKEAEFHYNELNVNEPR
jgi:hypothetical protein